jgi:hypothetical protein
MTSSRRVAGRFVSAFFAALTLGLLVACSSTAPPETTVTVHLSAGLAARSYQISVLDAKKKQIGTANLAPGDSETIHVRTTEVTIVVPKVCSLTSTADGTPIKATIGKGRCSI